MKTNSLLGCVLFLHREFALLVRGQQLTRDELLDWLGWDCAGVFWTVQRAGLFQEVEGRIGWSPAVLSPDGACLRLSNHWVWPDKNEVRTF